MQDCFFNPELERHRLPPHQHCHEDSIRTMRDGDVHLIDFVELTLKSKDDIDAAFDIVPSTNLLEYLKHLLLPPQPGDWPAQFYSRQVIYETLQKYLKYTEASAPPHSQPQSFSTAAHSVHSYTMSYHSKPEKEKAIDQPDILSLLPCIGPFHISLTGQETLLDEFRDLFELIYPKLFPKSKLAKNPAPWCISLLLEVVYKGWLYIRESVKGQMNQKFDIFCVLF